MDCTNSGEGRPRRAARTEVSSICADFSEGRPRRAPVQRFPRFALISVRGGHGGPPIHGRFMRRVAIISILFLFGCSFQSGAAQEISLARGSDLLKHGSYKEAIQVFTSLLDKNSKDAAAAEGLIRAQIETGDYANAEKRARDFLNAQPEAAPIRIELGEIKFETGRYAEAASEFERAAQNSKAATLLRAMLGRARSLRAQGKEDEAAAIAQELVR